MRKKWIILLTVSMLTLQVFGCGKQNAAETETENTIVESVENTADTEQGEGAAGTTADLPELEVTVIDGPADLVCTLPAGFDAYEEEEGIYVNEDYPSDNATISHVISEEEDDITGMTRDEYQAMMEADFLETYGDDVAISITQYDPITVSGRDGLKIKTEYNFKGDDYEQLIYIVYSGTETHILTYTQEKDAGWMDEFEKSGDGISLVSAQ